MAGERIDLASDSQSGPPAGRGRRFVGMRFACCDLYTRVYINSQGTAYEGHCPRCSRPVRIGVGPEGTDCRFFTAY